MAAVDSQPIIAFKALNIKDRGSDQGDLLATRDILLLVRRQLMKFNSYERSELGLVAV
jgi:hypothetical protein